MGRPVGSLPSPVLTAPVIAHLLERDQRTVRRWIDRGLLPGWVSETGRYLAYRNDLIATGWL